MSGSAMQPCAPVECAVAGVCWLSKPTNDLGMLRSEVAAAYPDTLSVGTLKQADEQTLVALLALRHALDDAGLRAADCEAWGLVAAPRLPGRKRIADAIAKFREVGAWGVSPHIIPHCSLHSLAGTLSQALQLHGPNIGAGGMPGLEGDAFWAALTLLEGERAPGVWVVMTGWERESVTSDDLVCQAAVLGLRQTAEHSTGARLRFAPFAAPEAAKFSLEALGTAIAAGSAGSWDIGGAVCTLSPAGYNLEAAA